MGELLLKTKQREDLLLCPFCNGDNIVSIRVRTQTAVCGDCKKEISFYQFK